MINIKQIFIHKNYTYIIYVIIYMIMMTFFNHAYADETKKTKYTTDIQLINSSKTLEEPLKKFQEKLSTREIENNPSKSYIDYLINQDHLLLVKFLKSEGYYQAKIELAFDEKTYKAKFTVSAGVQYKFGTISIITKTDGTKTTEIKTPDIEKLHSKTNQAALISKIEKDESEIDKFIEKNNCFFKHHTSHQAILNQLTQKIDIQYIVSYNYHATYGNIKIQGLKTIDENYLLKLLTIKEGQCFKNSLLYKAITDLRSSNLLNKINVILPEKPNADGSVPIKYIVTEKPPHTIKMGASYSTDLGIGITTGWENRNVFRNGEKVSTNLSWSNAKKQLDATFEKPFFLRDDQKLEISSVIKQEDTDAYYSKGASLSGTIERKYSNKWVRGIGAKYSFEKTKDQDSNDKAMLLSIPIFASQDKRNNILDPQNGWTIHLKTSPAFDTMDVNTSFIKNNVSGTYYKPILSSDKSILALRATFGTILGASSKTIPATERFYGGGAGSIRGYTYQSVGPLDNENDPIGGKSFLELSSELRFRIKDDYGLVPFLDCGNAFSSKAPNSKDKLLCGSGIGFRYYTLFGPLRIDLAIPLNKRKGIDSAYQLYFSIGQSF